VRRYQGERTSAKLGVSDNYKSVRWTLMNSHLLNTFYETAPLSMQCNQSDGHKFPVSEPHSRPSWRIRLSEAPATSKEKLANQTKLRKYNTMRGGIYVRSKYC